MSMRLIAFYGDVCRRKTIAAIEIKNKTKLLWSGASSLNIHII